MSSSASVHLRSATAADAALVLDFIRQLAAYEKLLDKVENTEDNLRAQLFGEAPAAHVLLAEVDGQAVGFAVYFFNYSTFVGRPGLYLEDLFVRPEFRSRGVGQALLRGLAQIAADRNCGRMEWSVLDWNAPAIGFYRRLGATILPDWRICRLDRTGIAQLAAGQLSPKTE